MRKGPVLVLLLLLVIAPALPLTVEPTTTATQLDSMPDDVPEELMNDIHAADSVPEEGVELDMLFFTETASSENGLYYVCRRGTDAVAYFGASMVKYLSGGTAFTMEFPGSRAVIPKGENPTGSTTNYLYGNDPSKWKTGVEDCSLLRYPEIYPGIDLVYKIQDGNLKYEFVVSPYADPDVIGLDYKDAEAIELQDDTVIVTRHGQRISDSGLEVFQNNGEITVGCGFSSNTERHIGFNLNDYDQSIELIIDPVLLSYSTFLGSTSWDFAYDIAVEDGYSYVTGSTISTNFPVVNAFDETHNGNHDCFVTKLATDGQSLVYSTFLGGTSNDVGNGIAVENGYAYVTGNTASTGFPTVNALDSDYAGEDCFVSILSDEGDSDSDGLTDWEEEYIYSTDPYCVDSDGDNYLDGYEIDSGTDPLDPYHYPGLNYDLQYSSYLGNSLDDLGYSIAVEDGYTYVSGQTLSPDFPTMNAFDSTHNGNYDVYIVKLSFDCRTILYSTFLGGTESETPWDMSVEDGYVYLTGQTESSDFPTYNAYDSTYNASIDCFVTKLGLAGSTLVYSTFLGGPSYDYARGIAVEDGHAYVAGYTESSSFPTINAYDDTYGGNRDCFVTKFATDGQSLIYSTFLGGHSYDYCFAIAVEDASVYVTGRTLSSTFPLVNEYDGSIDGIAECFVTKFATDGQSLVYSTFLGGNSDERCDGIAVEDGYAYVTGTTESSNFPVLTGYSSTHNGYHECFVTKLATSGLSLIYSTLLGGTSEDYAKDIAVENGRVCITGQTNSTDFPLTQEPMTGSGYESFITLLTSSGRTLAYSTLIGGEGFDMGMSIDMMDDTVYVTGYTNSNDFPAELALDPTYNGDYDSFIWVMGLDSDKDGLCDSWESMLGTDPDWIDSDNDNFLDGYEVAYGSDPLDPMSYPAMPAAWYQSIYEDLDGNATLIQNLISWSDGNATLLQTIMDNLNANATLLQQVISWLDGNHTAIETLFTYVQGNATLLLSTVDAVDANTDQLSLLAALVTHNTDMLATLNATHIGDIEQIRAVLDMLGATVGDTDYDGLDDLDEIALGTDIQCIDTDCDNLNDAFEVKIGTDPLDDDSDADSYLDGIEVIAGTNPLDASDYPGATTSTTTTTTTSTSITTSSPPNEFSPLVLLLVIGGAGAVVVVLIVLIMKRRRG